MSNRSFSSVIGSVTDYFMKHMGTGTGANFMGTDLNDTELLMQVQIGTGSDATARCKGGTKT